MLWTIPGTGDGGAGAGARPGAHPGAGRARRPRALRAPRPAAATATARSCPTSACCRCRSRRRATCSSTSRATRSRWRTAWTTSSASSSRRLPDADGQPTFHTIWSIDEHWRRHPGGREARVRDADRLLHGSPRPRIPNLHIYHYAPYEPTAIGRLMGRHATREEEVDRLMRGQGLRGPVSRRSPGHARVGRELLDQEAGAAVRVRAHGRPARCRLEHRRIRDVAGARRRDGRAIRAILDRIAGYNRDDCVSTLAAAGLAGRATAGARGRASVSQSRGRSPHEAAPPSEPPGLHRQLAAAVGTALAPDVPADPLSDSRTQQARWLLAQLLGWHRREEKPGLVALLPPAQRPDGRGAAGGAGAARGAATLIASRADEAIHDRHVSFPPQDHDISGRPDASSIRPRRRAPGTVVDARHGGGHVDRKLGTAYAHRTHVDRAGPGRATRGAEASLLRIGGVGRAIGLERRRARYWAARDLLLAPAARRPARRPASRSRGPARDRRRCRSPDRRSGDDGRLSRDPGAARLGQVHNGRGHDRRPRCGGPARRRHVEQPQGDRQPAGQGRRRRRERGVPVRIGQKPGSRTRSRRTRVRAPLLDERGRRRRARHRRGRRRRRQRRGSGRARRSRQPSTRCSSMRPARCRSRTSSRCRRRRRSSSCSATRSSWTSRSRARIRPGAERSALGASARRATRRCRRTAGCSSITRGACTPTSARSRRTSSTRTELQPQPGTERPASSTVAGPLGGTGSAGCRSRHAGELERIATRRRPRWPRRSRACSRRARSGSHPRRAGVPVTLEDVLVITPYNAQVREHRRGAARRARRDGGQVPGPGGRRSPSTRWPPAPIEEAPRGHGVPVQPPPAQRRDIARARAWRSWSPARSCIRVRCRTPRQMQLANGLARLLEFATADAGDRNRLEAARRSRDTLGVTTAAQDARPWKPSSSFRSRPTQLSPAIRVEVRDRLLVDRLDALGCRRSRRSSADAAPEERPALVERALRIGLTALQEAGVTRQRGRHAARVRVAADADPGHQ